MQQRNIFVILLAFKVSLLFVFFGKGGDWVTLWFSFLIKELGLSVSIMCYYTAVGGIAPEDFSTSSSWSISDCRVLSLYIWSVISHTHLTWIIWYSILWWKAVPSSCLVIVPVVFLFCCCSFFSKFIIFFLIVHTEVLNALQCML